MAGRLLSSPSVYLSHRDSVTFANMLAEWSTRPRATWLVFLTNFVAYRLSKKFGRAEDGEESESGHVVAAATTYIGEVIVSLFGLRCCATSRACLYPGPTRRWIAALSSVQTWPPTLASCWFASSALLDSNSVILVLWLITRDFKFYIWGTMGFTWLVTVLSWVGSIWVWKDLLDSTPVELYCIEESTSIDLVYGLLPVALELWRAACVTSTR